MIDLEVRGIDETIADLDEWVALLESDALWIPVTQGAAEEFRRFAMDISPVITGAYRGSHIIVHHRMAAIMTIDPAALNPVTGTPVTRYAAAVEERHHIYQRTFDNAAERAGVEGARLVTETLERLAV